MKKFRLMVILLVVLSLLVAVSASVSAGKPPGKQKDKTAEKGNNGKKDKNKPPAAVKVPPGQAKRGSELGDEDPPTDPPDSEDDPAAKVLICHKPGDPAEKELWLPPSALPGHLGHGDTEGTCGGASPPDTPPETDDGSMRVAVCHKFDTPAEKTLWLPEDAIPGHKAHGDTEGPCPQASPPDTLPETEGSPVRVTICHKAGTPAEKTLRLPWTALNGHKAHGDEEGPCPDDSSTDTPPATDGDPLNTDTDPVYVVICHKPTLPEAETLMVPPSAVPGHMRHGDLMGDCDVLQTDTWATKLMVAYYQQLMMGTP